MSKVLHIGDSKRYNSNLYIMQKIPIRIFTIEIVSGTCSKYNNIVDSYSTLCRRALPLRS